jgi:negative regulator of sigma E activity
MADWGKTITKVAKWGAALAAAYVVAGAANAAIRGSREYKEPTPDTPSMMPPMSMAPEIPMYAAPEYAMAPQQDTLMGMQKVEGEHARRVKAARGQGMAQGVNASAPNLEQNGQSTVDGRPVQDMGRIGI